MQGELIKSIWYFESPYGQRRNSGFCVVPGMVLDSNTILLLLGKCMFEGTISTRFCDTDYRSVIIGKGTEVAVGCEDSCTYLVDMKTQVSQNSTRTVLYKLRQNIQSSVGRSFQSPALFLFAYGLLVTTLLLGETDLPLPL